MNPVRELSRPYSCSLSSSALTKYGVEALNMPASNSDEPR